MASAPTDLLEIILRACAAAKPQPWYPSDYAKATGLPRDILDASLDQLRLGGLVRLTDWMQGKGQGYVLTPAGELVLERPRLVERLRAGDVPRAEAPSSSAAPTPGARSWNGEKPPGWERAKAIREALLTQTRPTITLALLAANILVFLAGVPVAQKRGVLEGYLSGGLFTQQPQGVRDALAEIWNDFGALNRLYLLEGQWWRLWTTCFLHMGLLHLAMNMYFLYVVGPLLERMLGSGRYLLLYLIAGLTGSCAAMIFDPATTPIGASGALCGLLGAMAAWVYLNRPYLPPEISGTWMRSILTNVILIVFISLIPGVSGWGHLGGGVGGLLAAVPLTYSRFGEGPRRWLGFVGVLVIPAVAILWLLSSLGPDLQAAQQRLRPAIQWTKQIGWKCYLGQVEPLCRQVENGKAGDETKVQRALRATAATAKEMQAVAEQLPSADAQPDPRFRAVLEESHTYLKAWIALFEQFHKVFADPQGRTPEGVNSIFDLKGRVERTEQLLQDSVLSPD
jgi:rhomboid protease GluP